MIQLPEHPLLPKPRHGSACNGCGLCCHLELCGIARMAFKEGTKAPCPAMVFKDGRVLCAFVEAEAEHGLTPMIRDTLAIGHGCSMDD